MRQNSGLGLGYPCAIWKPYLMIKPPQPTQCLHLHRLPAFSINCTDTLAALCMAAFANRVGSVPMGTCSLLPSLIGRSTKTLLSHSMSTQAADPPRVRITPRRMGRVESPLQAPPYGHLYSSSRLRNFSRISSLRASSFALRSRLTTYPHPFCSKCAASPAAGHALRLLLWCHAVVVKAAGWMCTRSLC